MGLSPMMMQYNKVKEKCEDCILFFRVGDFYEMFFEDAKLAARELELVLTGKDCGLTERAPMCGIPYHAAQSYIAKLVGKGYKVAIGEQLENPAEAQGLVKRDIIKIFTPGTFTDSSYLEEKRNNYIMSIYFEDGFYGLSFSDISTGEFLCTKVNSVDTKEAFSLILDETSKYSPKEILIPEEIDEKLIKAINERLSVSYTVRKKDYFTEGAEDILKSQFKNYNKNLVKALKCSSAGLLSYIFETQKISLSNITNMEVYEIGNYLLMDINTRRNLELTETLRDKTKKGSLLWVLDNTVTSMGGRKLRKWVEEPLIKKEKIELRLDAVEEMSNNHGLLSDLRDNLKEVYDIERIAGKISSKSINPKEIVSLKNSIGKIPMVYSILSKCSNKYFNKLYKDMDLLEDIYDLIDKAILDSPSLTTKEGDLIKEGFNKDVDELKEAKKNGKNWIASLEANEREFTGIKSLKVSYNKVFGYYIEVTKANISMVPEGRYIRKQTLTNGERYITGELKEMEDKILGAEEKLINLEYSIFCTIRDEVEKNTDRIKKTADILSSIDCILSLAYTAINNNYKKPEINEKGLLEIKDGRHPVVEKVINEGNFISNDSHMDLDKNKLLIITGPNMAGKSTYMRQVALITLMAQIGSFVPAESSNISICDKIFTRIGASDDLSGGKSTFMVEMWEVANILKNSTKRSLVLLDEVGRGTSTYDGLSIAWAVIEYMSSNKKHSCKTLFATHYHELISLEGKLPGVLNYSIAVKKIEGEVSFLRKIIKGGASESYGIEVAELAGIPNEVTVRAKEILCSLEKDKSKGNVEKLENVCTPAKAEAAVTHETFQLDFTMISKENLIEKIKSINVLNLNPMEAMNKLYEIVNEAKEI